MRFTTWLLLGLEFELAADVIRTAVSPAWNTCQLGAIATTRTALDYFLAKTLRGVAKAKSRLRWFRLRKWPEGG